MKKRVLFAIPQHAAFRNPISKAFRQLGMEVFYFDYLKPDFVSRGLGTLANILSNKRLAASFKQWVNKQLLQTITSLSPDYLFVIKGETIKADTIGKINTLKTSTINWFPDNVGSWNLLMQTARSYDHYISVCQYLTRKLNAVGRPTLYLPVADVADNKLTNLPKKYDLVFAGHKTRKREKYFAEILDLGFHLWGYPHWKESPVASHYRGLLTIPAMKQMFRYSKIVINVSTGEEGVPLSIANLKSFEATGVGAFVLSEYSPALAELFQENKEMVFFRTKEEMRKKAIYYLKRDALRQLIAVAGWRRTAKDHTYERRLRLLFDYIKTMPKPRKPR